MKRFRNLGVEDYILIIIGVLVILMVTYVMSGCTSRIRSHKVIWHDGNCLLYTEGLSAIQARELSEQWQFKDCEVIVNDKE